MWHFIKVFGITLDTTSAFIGPRRTLSFPISKVLIDCSIGHNFILLSGSSRLIVLEVVGCGLNVVGSSTTW